MKKISLSMTASLIAIAGILLIIYFLSSGKAVKSSYSYGIILPDSDTALGGIFSSLHVQDSTPYYIYKKSEDSFNSIKQIRDNRNSGKAMESISNGVMGVFSTNKKTFSELPFHPFNPGDTVIKSFIDSLNKVYLKPSAKESEVMDELINKKLSSQTTYRMDSINKELEKEKLYYFGLRGYELKDYDTQFYIADDKYHLAYVKWDRQAGENHNKEGHYESKQIKVRYTSERKTILIPISKKIYKILNITIWAFSFLTGALILYFFFGLPIRLLINISKGKAFTKRNIQMLNQVCLFAIIISFFTIVSPYIFRLLFWQHIPDDFKMESLLNKIFDNLVVLFIAVITFIIAKAFKKGYTLQYEQDLTI
ncbi:MAG: DUF2975 domain-containing protein [Chitinophagaceae bacterium]|nr:DUF2975 domain-containing protein [Chitinophagaceae bacterium]